MPKVAKRWRRRNDPCSITFRVRCNRLDFHSCVGVCVGISEGSGLGATAHKTGDHKFVQNFAKAKVEKAQLLATAGPRWAKVELKIIKACGAFKNAADFDRDRQHSGSGYVPEDQFMAIYDTSDIDKLVKN
jgi:hypothetical protein